MLHGNSGAWAAFVFALESETAYHIGAPREHSSGTGIRERDAFQHLIPDCEAGKIDIVLTKSTSRFARNTVDLLATVRRLKELGVEVYFEKEYIQNGRNP